MSDLRNAALRALEALEHAGKTGDWSLAGRAFTTLKAALAEPVQEPVAAVAKNATAQFDHAIGADRFKVVRGPFWWHVLIGDGTKKHGKFHSRAGAEQMAADLLREFRNGAFVQHTAPPQRKPLTEEEIAKCWHNTPWNADLKTRVFAFARAVEAAHGIKEEK